MKVVLINTYDTYGGAAVACQRLLNALQAHPKIDSVRMLVQEKKGDNALVEGWANTYWTKKQAFLKFSLERLSFLRHEKSKQVRFAFSPANTGVDITQHPLVQQADIIHLHWINFGFLSVKSLEKLFRLGKPVFWTLHDMWAFTGGCHYAGTCIHYQVRCGDCDFLKSPKPKDLSARILQKKFRAYHQAPLDIVTCSKWLADIAQQSSLFKRSINAQSQVNIQSIPNPINVDTFQPTDKAKIRKKLGIKTTKLQVLFGAMNVADQRKGFKYFQEALQILRNQYPDLDEQMELLIFGKASPELLQALPYPVNNLGVLSGNEPMSQAYNAADLFVIPSLEDNLPNTIMESLACGTPTVAFRTGGIPDMIDHQQNGYLAQYQDANDLAKGIYWALTRADYPQLAQNARQKVLNNFTEKVVADQYVQLYEKILAQKNTP